MQQIETTPSAPVVSGADAPMPTVRRWWRAARRSPWSVAALVLLLYALWTGVYLRAGHEPRDFIVLGRARVTQSSSSALIRIDPTYAYDLADPLGYDGQYCYFLALDPANAPAYMDWPAYRYTRLLYPLLARLVAWGQPTLIPLSLIVVNWLALGAGALLLAAWLRRRGCSPWLALLFSCSTGLFIAYQGDLTEPLAYALVVAAVYVYDSGSGQARASLGRVLLAGVCFALAGITRETTLVFAGVYALGLLMGDSRTTAESASSGAAALLPRLTAHAQANWRRAALLLGVACAPLALVKLALLLWLGSLGVPPQVQLARIPFGGLLAYWPLSGYRVVEVEGVVLPALLCAGVALWALWRGAWRVEIVALLVNILLFVVLLPKDSYIDQLASARIATGVVLAALLCLPTLDRLTRHNRAWLFACGALWLAFLPIQALGILLHR